MEIIVGVCLLMQAVWDFRTKELPLWITIVLGSCGLIYSLYIKREGWDMIFALLPGLFCLVIGYITRQSVGYGDGILIGVLGLFYTWKEIFEICSIAIMVAGFVGLILLVIFKKNGKYEIPFIPFLFLGWCLFYGMRFIGGLV